MSCALMFRWSAFTFASLGRRWFWMSKVYFALFRCSLFLSFFRIRFLSLSPLSPSRFSSSSSALSPLECFFSLSFSFSVVGTNEEFSSLLDRWTTLTLTRSFFSIFRLNKVEGLSCSMTHIVTPVGDSSSCLSGSIEKLVVFPTDVDVSVGRRAIVLSGMDELGRAEGGREGERDG